MACIGVTSSLREIRMNLEVNWRVYQQFFSEWV